MIKIFSTALIICLALGLGGCSNPNNAEGIKPTEAQKELVELLQSDYEIPVIAKTFPDTLWIYLPLKESFFQLKTSDSKSTIIKEVQTSQVINFLEAKAQEKDLIIDYDIGPMRSYPKDLGYSSAYTEKFQRMQQNILQGISRVYANVEETDDNQYAETIAGDRSFKDAKKNKTHKDLVRSFIPSKNIPSFAVLIFADIITGIELKVTFHIGDLLRAQHDQGFYEEYSRRFIYDQPRGDKSIIGDTTGDHIQYKDLSWHQFLAQQIQSRVNFKYTQSKFPPSDNPKAEIIEIIAQTLAGYSFEDFDQFVLTDLVKDSSETIPFTDITSLIKKHLGKSSKGRLVEINFGY
ncbi:hypothetical protein MNBD_BACTEROID05-906 [hydrothermal vent metagenome]|uniref:Lipoprotein n=1 Tax=hydrothermal vent metagenome TaxID=652676 RepID=A0A3B0TA22_9ZZZZ